MRGIIQSCNAAGLPIAALCCLIGLASADEPWPRHVIDDTLRGADGVKLADFDGNGRLDVVTGWEEGGQTRVYLHPSEDRVREAWPSVAVGRTPNVEDALPVDLDGDGSMDVVSLCEGNTPSIFVQWGSHGGDARAVMHAARWRQELLSPPLPAMQWMFAATADRHAENEVVLVAGGKGDGAFVGRIVVAVDGSRAIPPHPRPVPQPTGEEKEENGDSSRREGIRFRWQSLSPVGWVMSIVPLDMDGDGDLDVLLSDRRGPLRGVRWLENPLPGGDEEGKWTNHFIGGQDREVMFLTSRDFDSDGLQDILVAAKPASVVWFRRTDANGGNWDEQESPFPPGSGTAKAVAVGDMNRNGKNDLVVSCEAAHDELSGVWWYRSGDGNRFKDGTWHDVSGPQGTKYDVVELIDLDEDGDLDVLTCEEAFNGRGLGVVWYENPHH